MTSVAVIGAGSWGTALAQLLASSNVSVRLWARRQELADSLNRQHRNPDYLASCELSDAIVASSDLAWCLDGAESALLVTPSQTMRAMGEAIAACSEDAVPLLICSKGIEAATGLLSTQVLEEVLGPDRPLAVLSGPNHAEEVVAAQPAASVVASTDEQCADYFVHLLGGEAFRTYASHDVVGVQLCGAFKNVIAIAVGGGYGLGLGDNTAALLITRGQAEMSRLVVACGGAAITCMGLAGTGDLVVTCMSRHSRNRVFGQDYLACGRSLGDFEADHHMVVEGAASCAALVRLAEAHGVELPIATALRAVIEGRLEAADVVGALTTRPLTEEFYGIS